MRASSSVSRALTGEDLARHLTRVRVPDEIGVDPGDVVLLAITVSDR